MPPKRKTQKNTNEAQASPPKKFKTGEIEKDAVEIEVTNQNDKNVKGKQGRTTKPLEKPKPKPAVSPVRRSERSKPVVNYVQVPETNKAQKKTKVKNGITKSPKKQDGWKSEVKKSGKSKKSEEETEEEDESFPSIYDFKANKLNGEESPLSSYKGYVCLIVNVASKCGHTKAHYEQLVELYAKYQEKGLRILAFPCNQFGGQEPGNADKICEFVAKKNVSFDMFDKINVKGKSAHALYNYLTGQKDGPKGKDIEWNFVKFLVDKEGNFVDRYKPGIKPLQMVDDIENLL